MTVWTKDIPEPLYDRFSITDHDTEREFVALLNEAGDAMRSLKFEPIVIHAAEPQSKPPEPDLPPGSVIQLGPGIRIFTGQPPVKFPAQSSALPEQHGVQVGPFQTQIYYPREQTDTAHRARLAAGPRVAQQADAILERLQDRAWCRLASLMFPVPDFPVNSCLLSFQEERLFFSFLRQEGSAPRIGGPGSWGWHGGWPVYAVGTERLQLIGFSWRLLPERRPLILADPNDRHPDRRCTPSTVEDLKWLMDTPLDADYVEQLTTIVSTAAMELRTLGQQPVVMPITTRIGRPFRSELSPAITRAISMIRRTTKPISQRDRQRRVRRRPSWTGCKRATGAIYIVEGLEDVFRAKRSWRSSCRMTRPISYSAPATPGKMPCIGSCPNRRLSS
jgi:hypothetical protein